jgi:hypothetical protein
MTQLSLIGQLSLMVLDTRLLNVAIHFFNGNDMFEVNTFDIQKFDEILAKGLSKGLGDENGQMCIEAAICNVLGLPHSDDPECVASSVRDYKIRLNDADWSSSEARAKGLRNLGLAQLGSLGIVKDYEFSQRICLLTIQKLIPALLREIFPDNAECLAAATQCEIVAYSVAASADSARAAAARARAAVRAAAARARAARADSAAAARAYYAAYAADSAVAAAVAAVADSVAVAADYAAVAADYAAVNNDKYLIMSADLALQVLQELGSPGCDLLTPA